VSYNLLTGYASAKKDDCGDERPLYTLMAHGKNGVFNFQGVFSISGMFVKDRLKIPP
jgi:hypothetical protein